MTNSKPMTIVVPKRERERDTAYQTVKAKTLLNQSSNSPPTPNQTKPMKEERKKAGPSLIV